MELRFLGLRANVTLILKCCIMTGFLDHSQERSADTMDFPVLEKPFRKDKFLGAVRSIFDAAEANKTS